MTKSNLRMTKLLSVYRFALFLIKQICLNSVYESCGLLTLRPSTNEQVSWIWVPQILVGPLTSHTSIFLKIKVHLFRPRSVRKWMVTGKALQSEFDLTIHQSHNTSVKPVLIFTHIYILHYNSWSRMAVLKNQSCILSKQYVL